MNSDLSADELKSSVELCLKEKNLKDLVLNVKKSSEEGDGMQADIIFLDIKGTQNGKEETYNIALKTTKNGITLEQNVRLQVFFQNEVYFFKTLLPEFKKFQLERGIQTPFSSVPECYGSLFSNDKAALAMEDLVSNGYTLWEKKQPMTRSHISLVIREYAKFHAISVAMIDQCPEKYDAIVAPVNTLVRKLADYNGNQPVINFAVAIAEIADLLEGDLEDRIVLRWRQFGRYMENEFLNIMKNYNGFKVVNHGDCWNNNFVFRIKDNNIREPTQVAVLDWQMIKLGSPVNDLSHFLFTCISKEDLKDLDDILDEYYTEFSNYLKRLKSDLKVYSKAHFLQDWKQYSKVGIMVSSLVMKICALEKDEALEMVKIAQTRGRSEIFRFDVRNTEFLKERMKHLVKYVVENDLI